MINEDFSLKDSGYSNTETSTDLPRHRWYFFKEAFSPHLVEKAIDDAKCVAGDLIIDPFCGSGTVPLTSSLKSFSALGIEVNPFLAFVSRTKLIQVKPVTLEKVLQKVVQESRKGKVSSLETFSTFSENGGRKKWLFNTNVLRAFEGGWLLTNDMYPPVRDLVRLALLGAAMDNCNAYTDGKCLRYRKNWQELKYGKNEFIAAFEDRITNMVADLKDCPNRQEFGEVVFGDSRAVLGNTLPNKFKLCVTSPPYLNSFDYTDVYRPELFLGKFISTQDNLYDLRLSTVRSHVQAKWDLPVINSFGAKYDEVSKLITERSDLLWNKKIPIMVQAYFEDMRKILVHLHSKANAQSKAWIVVSTSAYAGIEIPVDLIIADIAAQVGWFLQEVGVIRYLRTSGQNWQKWSETDGKKPKLRESVVILSASPSTAHVVHS